MSCDCEAYVNCSDGNVEVPVIDESAEYSHSCEHIMESDDVLGFYQKTSRSFSVRYGWDRSIGIDYVLSGCSDSYYSCDNTAIAISTSVCSENCIRETNVPYYWDQQRGIFVWKHVEESLSFDIMSHQTAVFRMKWGNVPFHKLCIPTSVKTQGKEQFLMVKGGGKSVLAEVEYQYNPFPVAESGGTTWGLYGNVIVRDAVPDTDDIACILIFPTVPKLAMTFDNDVVHYGFYDYNSIEGGFTENSLPKDDGGKDYFYPYWCRSMPTDLLWRNVADQRYEVIYSKGAMNLAGTVPWSPSEPVTYPLPCGSFALDSKENFIASCILQFGEHAESTGVVYNEASMGDLFAALTKATVPLSGRFSSLYPVTPL